MFANNKSIKFKLQLLILFDLMYRKLHNYVNILKWFFPTLKKYKIKENLVKKRLLVVYDLDTQPFSIGDFLLVQEASIILQKTYQVDLIDIAIVYNPMNPVPSNAVFQSITPENFLYFLPTLLSVAQLNKYLGSLLVFNSHNQLEKHVTDNLDRYEIWPSGFKARLTREYLHYAIFDEIIYPFYLQNGSIPSLTIRPMLEQWADGFFKTHADGLVSITVNIRNNKSFDDGRNIDIEAWIGFFKHCEKYFPAKFFIICAQSEIDERFRSCSNICLVKDFYTNIEQELALIQRSSFHMGSASGPIAAAWFSKKPYFIVRSHYRWLGFENSAIVIKEGEHLLRFCFASQLQYMCAGPENKELLIKHFKAMWESLSFLPEKIKSFSENNSIKHQNSLSTWLR